MKKSVLFIFVFAAAAVATMFVLRPNRLASSAAASSAVDPAATGSFGFDLLREFASLHPDTNTVVSPSSVKYALGMVATGARGRTLTGVMKTLRASGTSVEALNNSNQASMKSLTDPHEGVTLKIADSLWVQQGESIRPEFIEACARYYAAPVTSVNFASPNTLTRINAWVKENTQNMIPKAFEELDSGTLVVLLNTVYFKGTWTQAFDQKLTQKREFHASERTVEVPMMSAQRGFEYAETPDFQAIKLPYGPKGSQRMSMLVFLPSEKLGLSGFLNRLTAASFDKWRGSLSSHRVVLGLPKFKIAYSATQEFKVVLSKMGMADAFSPGADLSGISPGLFITQAVHKVVVDVNETGTEAAAVTGFAMARSAMPQPKIATMIVDRPFFFVIWDEKTKSCLFAGAVNDPT